MVKGSIGDRILECIGYPESWTEQEIEDNKRVIQEEFSKIDSHVVKAVVARLCDKIEEPKRRTMYCQSRVRSIMLSITILL